MITLTKEPIKVVAVGALRGFNILPELPDLINRYDKVIIMGDYIVGPNDVKDDELVRRIMKLLYFQKQNKDKVVLLVGANDIPYFFLDANIPNRSTRKDIRYQVHTILDRRIGQFKVCYQIGKYLFSHGGITGSWLNGYIEEFVSLGLGLTDDNLASFINKYASMSESKRKELVYPIDYSGLLSQDVNPVQCNRYFLEFDLLHSFIQITASDTVNAINYEEDITLGAKNYQISCLESKKPTFFTVTIE